jgi:hypothetical protein
MFSLGCFFENYRSCQNTLVTFYHAKSSVFILTKYGVADAPSHLFVPLFNMMYLKETGLKMNQSTSDHERGRIVLVL